MKDFYNEIKIILPLIITLLIGMILLFPLRDHILNYKYGAAAYVYSILFLGIFIQFIYIKIKFKKNKKS
jgi:hypothetical protein